jgi:hypothetical protein
VGAVGIEPYDLSRIARLASKFRMRSRRRIDHVRRAQTRLSVQSSLPRSKTPRGKCITEDTKKHASKLTTRGHVLSAVSAAETVKFPSSWNMTQITALPKRHLTTLQIPISTNTTQKNPAQYTYHSHRTSHSLTLSEVRAGASLSKREGHPRGEDGDPV